MHPEHAGHEVQGRLQVGPNYGLGGDPDELLAGEAEAAGGPDQVPGLAPGAVQDKHPALRPIKLAKNNSEYNNHPILGKSKYYGNSRGVYTESKQ